VDRVSKFEVAMSLELTFIEHRNRDGCTFCNSRGSVRRERIARCVTTRACNDASPNSLCFRICCNGVWDPID
jgi:hypothetical protein